MSGQNRQYKTDIKKLLSRHGKRIPFIQLIRLLQIFVQRGSVEQLDEDQLLHYIRTRPKLSLDFPSSDVSAVASLGTDQRTKIPKLRVTATFLGLYGSSSPLPTFYTEDLFDELREDISITREFLDVINNSFYILFFKVWRKKSLSIRYAEDQNDSIADILYSMLGLGEEGFRSTLPDHSRFLRFIGISNQKPRSAEGLRVVLSDLLNEPNVSVHQCILNWVAIPQDQRCRIGIQGNELGTSSYLGSQILDRMGKFRVQIGPLSAKRFMRLLPDRPVHTLFDQGVKFYLDQPLDWDIQLNIKKDQIEPARLGGKEWSQLGWNTWILSKNEKSVEGRVVLQGNC